MPTYSIRQLSDKTKRTMNSCIMCDSTNYLQMLKPDLDTWQVKCMGCYSTGPVMESRVAAIEAWNRVTE